MPSGKRSGRRQQKKTASSTLRPNPPPAVAWVPPWRRLRTLYVRVLLLALVAATTLFFVRRYRLLDSTSPPPDRLSSFSEPSESWVEPWPDASEDQFLLGVGKADITGPVVEINLNGYADRQQLGSGLRQRVYSRAFIVGSLANPADRLIYLVLDTQSGDTAIRYAILAGLRKLGPRYAMYGHDNVAVTGTHSHSGPGGWNNYLLPQLPSLGFHRQSYQAIVDGCLLSIRRAHESLQPGYISKGKTTIHAANINRSLFSYLANPEEERGKYDHGPDDDGTVDRDMVMLKFKRAADGLNIGVLNWFPTHGTSMFGNNTVITGDNKGVAADMMEKSLRNDATAVEGFVAGFSQANMGDVSPNVLGSWCEDGTGEQCSLDKSTCRDGRSQKCHSRGPVYRDNDNGSASCYEIGRRQFQAAVDLYHSMDADDASHRLPSSVVKAVHTFHSMPGYEFTLPDGRLAKTCPGAFGYSFAAGTSDGPGAGKFTQHGSNASNTNLAWRFVGGLLKRAGQEQIECQHPKPILLDAGEAHVPYEWVPSIVDVQLLRVGDVVIIVSPGEATTMAGRRWKEAVASRTQELFGDELGGQEATTVIGGPGNTYAHYITTEEEYRIQRFEGASTLYGPHTLAALIHRSLELVPFLQGHDTPISPASLNGPCPPDNSNRSLSLVTGVLYDGRPWSRSFGHVLHSDIATPHQPFKPGATVSATFVGANPRNNLRLEETFAAVERWDCEGEQWQTSKDDSDWDLVFHWRRTSASFGRSEVTIVWEIPGDTPAGDYRIRYNGDAKSILGTVRPFTGTTDTFRVV